ncbi:unnamed protein product [Boreogadus saida]
MSSSDPKQTLMECKRSRQTFTATAPSLQHHVAMSHVSPDLSGPLRQAGSAGMLAARGHCAGSASSSMGKDPTSRGSGCLPLPPLLNLEWQAS